MVLSFHLWMGFEYIPIRGTVSFRAGSGYEIHHFKIATDRSATHGATPTDLYYADMDKWIAKKGDAYTSYDASGNFVGADFGRSCFWAEFPQRI
ncbi:MAG: hypothetical protein HUU32_16880 [Calditrichaceae bacterium]|nr:hypothetical protein [Calditrichia bacterium]NUQ43066.1 hypothetical protein [Calditrichaceae bacterium]